MKYLLMIYMNPDVFGVLSPEEQSTLMAGHDDLLTSLRETGELVGFAALADPTNSSTVRVRDGAVTATDGPYVETKEFLAGYYVVDCDTVERARERAAQIPDAQLTAIEVRPVMESGGMEM